MAGKPAGSLGLPPADEQFPDRQALKEIAGRYDQEFVGYAAAAERLTRFPGPVMRVFARR